MFICCIWGKKGVGKLPSDHFWLLKRALEIPIFNRMSPLRILHDHPFHIKSIWENNNKYK